MTQSFISVRVALVRHFCVGSRFSCYSRLAGLSSRTAHFISRLAKPITPPYDPLEPPIPRTILLILQLLDGVTWEGGQGSWNKLGLAGHSVRTPGSTICPLATSTATTPISWEPYGLREDTLLVVGTTTRNTDTAAGDEQSVHVRGAVGGELQ